MSDLERLLRLYPHDVFGPLFHEPREAQAFYLEMMRIDERLSMRLRDQQILRESLEIALASKNSKTSESRMSLAEDLWKEICSKYRIPPNELQAMSQYVDSARKEFATVRYLNEAQGLIEHASRLKTEGGRQKRLIRAEQIIQRGLQDYAADKSRLNKVLQDLQCLMGTLKEDVQRHTSGQIIDIDPHEGVRATMPLPDVGTVGAGHATVRVTAAIEINKSPHRVRADELLKQATSLKADGEWDDAIRALREAYAILGDDIVNYSIATALRLPLYLQQAGRFAESMEEFQALLASWGQHATRAFDHLSGADLEHFLKATRVTILQGKLLAMKREKKRLAKLASQKSRRSGSA